MRNKNNTLYYRDYLTEVQLEIRDRIIKAKKDNRDILFVSDTGSGKTTLAMLLANDFVKEQIETGIVVPLQSIVKSKEGSNAEMDFGSGKYFTLHNELTNNSYFTVYNTFSNSDKVKTTEYLFVDEPQVLIQQANIRGVVNADIIDSNATKIYLTGTPFMLPQALGCDIVYLEREEPSTLQRIVKCYTSNDTDESIIIKIAEHAKGICTKVIRINDKKVITKMAGQLKSMGKTVATYYSADSKEAYLLENEAYLLDNDFEDLRKGIFNNVDFVLCTSALDSGVDLVCDREFFLYCIGRYDYERDTRLMPHPVDVKQFSARPRKQKVINVFCIGKFLSSTNTTSTHWEGQEAYFSILKGNSIDTFGYLKLLNQLYQALEYNDSASWTENLESLGMQVQHKGFLETIDGIKISLRRDLQVLKHLKQSKQYTEIIHANTPMLITADNNKASFTYKLGIDLESMSENPEDYVYTPASDVQIEELATYVRDASVLGVDLQSFLTERALKTKELKSVIDCLDSINRETLLGVAMRKTMKEGSISKEDLRLLEGEGSKLKTFLNTYFSINRNSFTQNDVKTVYISGLKKNSIVIPVVLIEYLEAIGSEWLNHLVETLNKKTLEDKRIKRENDTIKQTNAKPLGQQILI